MSGNQILLDPSSERNERRSRSNVELKPEPIQVDSFADRLMDELFDDVEKLLSGSVPPPDPVRVEPPKPVAVAETPQFSEIIPRPSLPQWQTTPRTDELAAIDELVRQKPVQPKRNGLQKFLVLVVCASAFAAATAWLIQRGTLQRLIASATQQPQAVAPAPVKSKPVDTNAQFAQYLQRSLEAVDRKVATGNPAAGVSTVPYNSSLPTVQIPGNQPLKSDAALPKTPVVVNVPSAPTNTTAPDPARSDLNQILTRLSSALERLSPTANRAPQGVVQPAPSARNSAANEPQRALRGIAIASDPTQSAVLFEMNGVTQRYYIGESIGSSGWSVVDISSNYVSVRRNGEVRSISVGQKL